MDLRIIGVDEHNDLRLNIRLHEDGSDVEAAMEVEQLLMDNFEVDRDDLDEREEFGNPIIGFLKCDLDAGEGMSILPQEFHDQNNIWKLDVLGDLIGSLQALQRDIHSEEYQ